jgi:predicted DNA-binding protein
MVIRRLKGRKVPAFLVVVNEVVGTGPEVTQLGRSIIAKSYGAFALYNMNIVRTTRVYSITMPPDMAKQAERLAKKENRTMSELMREAFRRYVSENARQQDLQQLKVAVDALRQEARQTGAGKLTMREIDSEIAAARRQRQHLKQPIR